MGWNPLSDISGGFNWGLGELEKGVKSANNEFTQAIGYYGPQFQDFAQEIAPYAGPLVGLALGATGYGLPIAMLGGAGVGGGLSLAGGEEDPGVYFRNMALGAGGGALGAGAAGLMTSTGATGGATTSLTPAGAAAIGSTPVAPSAVAPVTATNTLGGTGGAYGAMSSGAAGPTLARGGAAMTGGMGWTPLLMKGGLDFLNRQQAIDQMAPYTRASERAQARIDAYMQNPNLAYETDPAMRRWRKNRLDAVRSRQLATTGGLGGGNYARQLMAESAALDRDALNQILAQNQQAMAGAAPYVQAGMQAGGTPLGAFGQTGANVLNDYYFMKLIGGL